MPDGFGELAGDVDPGDLRAALPAEALLGPLVALSIVGVAGSVGGGLDERPAQVLGAVLGQRPADVAAAREAGLSDDAIVDALAVGFVFNLINRLADAFAFDVGDEEGRLAEAQALHKLAYKVPGFLLA